MSNLQVVAVAYADSQAIYANSYDELIEKTEASHNEEFEVSFVDGTEFEAWFASVIELDWCNIEQFFELCETGELEESKHQLNYLIGHCSLDLSEALEKVEEVCIFEGTKEDYAEELVNGCYDLEGFAKQYFDYEKFANDLDCGGDITEIEHNIWVTNANDR